MRSSRTMLSKNSSVSRLKASARVSSHCGYSSGSGRFFLMSCRRSHCAPNRVATASDRGILEHPADLTIEPGRRSQPAAGRGLDQFLVGHGAPEEERQARREIEVGNPVGLPGAQRRRRLLETEHESRIGQNGLQRQANAGFEVAVLPSLLIETIQIRQVVTSRRAAIRLQRQTLDDLVRTRRLLLSPSLAGRKRCADG